MRVLSRCGSYPNLIFARDPHFLKKKKKEVCLPLVHVLQKKCKSRVFFRILHKNMDVDSHFAQVLTLNPILKGSKAELESGKYKNYRKFNSLSNNTKIIICNFRSKVMVKIPKGYQNNHNLPFAHLAILNQFLMALFQLRKQYKVEF